MGYRYIGAVEERLSPPESLSAENETPDAAALGVPEVAQKSSANPTIVEAENVLVGSQSQMSGANARPTGRSHQEITSTVRPRPAVYVLTLVAFIALAAVAVSVYRFKRPSNTATAWGIHSLAILPFKPISEQNRDEFLELGMADALITKLSNITEVSVVPTGLVRKYASLTQDPIAAGIELKVDSVLEGSVQKLQQRIRVTVRLVRVSDRSFLWAETFDEQFADIFSLQDSISERVVEALAVRLSTPEKQQIAKRYTDNGEAYQLYQKGRYFWNKRTADALVKSIGFLEQATKVDPQYATAYAGLADAYIAASNFNLLPPEEAYSKAKYAARKAIEIDDNLAEAHAALAFSMILFDWTGRTRSWNFAKPST